uniref:Uncharacterized protein n=1 Tax=Parascaris univalens TaxID=6257 RepID=A0A915BT30_PARUN
AYKLSYLLAATVFTGLAGRSESAESNRICLPPFKRTKDSRMECVLDKKLLPNEAFLKHMCATYSGDIENGECFSYTVDEKATAMKCPQGYNEYYYEQVKYCMKAVSGVITGDGDLKDIAPKLCGDVTKNILFPWNKGVNMFAFALTGNGCTSDDTGNFYLWFDYDHEKNIANATVGAVLAKSAEVGTFKEQVEEEKLETRWLDGSRVFVEDENPVGSAVVFAKCGMWKVVPKEMVQGVICFALAA